MANALFNSMVRGFGFTLGRRAADSVINSSTNYSGGGMFGMTTSQQWKTIGLWFLVLVVLGNSYGMGAGVMWTIFGLIPCIMIMKFYYKIKVKKLEKSRREFLIPEINQLITKLENDFPFVELKFKGNLEKNGKKVDVAILENVYETLNSHITSLSTLKNKGYDSDTICNIYNEELWLGMSEEHMFDMKGQPTKTEKETTKDGKLKTTYIYGSKSSGDVLIFENGVLVSYKDR